MPQGDPGGNFAGSGGYGGNFGGAGGASMGSSPGGPAHGSLGFGGMSPGGYNSTTYANNMAGINNGQPGFGARVAAARAAAARRAFQDKYPNFPAQGPQPKPGLKKAGVVSPAVTTPPVDTLPAHPDEEELVGTVPGWPGYTGYGPTGGPVIQGTPGNGGVDVNNPYNEPQDLTGGHGPNMRGGGFTGRPSGSIAGNFRQFGGPVEPGQQYTVGENGPETLQMGPGGGGQVIPHNPMDRLGSMNPQMMQQLFQMQRQFGGGNQGPGGQPPAGPQPAPRPQGSGGFQPGMAQPPAQPPQAGGWQNRMGIEGLSRPMRPQGGGFGLSGLGQPGVMNQLRQQGRFAG